MNNAIRGGSVPRGLNSYEAFKAREETARVPLIHVFCTSPLASSYTCASFNIS
jgi:hypothetical protein